MDHIPNWLKMLHTCLLILLRIPVLGKYCLSNYRIVKVKSIIIIKNQIIHNNHNNINYHNHNHLFEQKINLTI